MTLIVVIIDDIRRANFAVGIVHKVVVAAAGVAIRTYIIRAASTAGERRAKPPGISSAVGTAHTDADAADVARGIHNERNVVVIGPRRASIDP